MPRRLIQSLIIIIVAVAAFIAGPMIWPPAAFEMGPSGAQLPFLLTVSALESIALGLGVVFLLYGWNWVSCVAQESKKVAWILYLSTAWLLVSWWPHDNMHISHDMADWWGLILIEYLFHVTLILAGMGLAWAFFKVMPQCQRKLM